MAANQGANSMFKVLGWVLLFSTFTAHAEPVTLTLLHTNDLHSHFRPDGGALGLGGIARLKTAIARERAAAKNTLLVDGGDWSEGDAYYIAGAGSETLKMMDRMGYDVAVVGNHDWLNGPDALLDAYQASDAKLKLVAANIAPDAFARVEEFKRNIAPYTIKQVGGVKIAFVGLVTYEFIYDSFFQPVRILPLKEAAQAAALAARAEGADAVIAISHNATDRNLELLRDVPEIDLVVGAHDHVLWTKPQVADRLPGLPEAWVVEAGKWGQHLGKVTLTITPKLESLGKPQVKLEKYELIQIDGSLKEDAETAKQVEKLEAMVEKKVGPVFHDHVGDSEVEVLWPTGSQDPLGTLNADAYLKASGADFAIESRGFVYGEIHPGALRSVDVFRSNPGVYSPKTGKAWTVSVLPIQGKKLQWLLNFVVTAGKAAGVSGLSASGLEMVYADAQATPPVDSGEIGGSTGPGGTGLPFSALSRFALGARGMEIAPIVEFGGSGVQEITVGGKPLDPNKTYRFAMSGGVRSALEFVDLIMPGTIPLDEIQDTGLEAWRVISDRVAALSPLTLDKVQTGNRIRSAGADLGLYYDDIQASAEGISVKIRNFGSAPSKPGRVELLANRLATDLTRDAEWTELAHAQILPEVAPLATVVLAFPGARPMRTGTNLETVTVRVIDSEGVPVAEQTRFFK